MTKTTPRFQACDNLLTYFGNRVHVLGRFWDEGRAEWVYEVKQWQGDTVWVNVSEYRLLDMERTTAQIQDEIDRVTLAHGTDYPYAELGKLWREMARAAGRENQPGWAQLAAALLADDYDRRART